MKILAPLARTDEVEPLVLSGADEFYCGLMNKSGPLNDRPNVAQFNFANAAELSQAVSQAHKFGKRVFLAINAQAVDFKEALDQVKAALGAQIDGLILANPLLIKKIKSMHPQLELNASCLGTVFNSESINFFKKLGIKRFHLPRQLGLEQLKLIQNNISGVQLSVFGMKGMCMNTEAFCLLHFTKKDRFIPCQHFKTITVRGQREMTKEYLDKKINMPRFSCSLCALRPLNKIGIESVKIEGRGADIQAKVRHVAIIKQALSKIKYYPDDTTYIRFCKRLFKEYFNEPCRKEYCYF